MAGGGCLWTSPISEMVTQSKGWDDDLEKDCDDDAENGVVSFVWMFADDRDSNLSGDMGSPTGYPMSTLKIVV